MPVYKLKDRQSYTYEFEFRGVRFRGSTGAASRREGEQVERLKRDEVRRDADRAEAAARSFKGEGPLTMTLAAARWWHEVGQHHAAPDTTWRDIERMVDWFSPQRQLDEISDSDVSAWVAARRGEHRKGDRKAALVKPATVNRTTVDALRKLFTRARKTWKLQIPSEPDWSRHRLKEAGERMVELRPDDQTRAMQALPPGYRDALAFALASGLRLGNVMLEWRQVEWGDGVADKGRITVVQKGGRAHVIPMSAEMRAILSACRGHDPVHVFTFCLSRRNVRLKLPKGARLPVTARGLQSRWNRLRAGLGIDVHFHGLRHTAGTRLVRVTGNLKLAQKLLGHASITTTAAYYAHADENDLRNALDKTPLASPHAAPADARKTLRNRAKT